MKYMGIIVTIVLGIIGGSIGYGQLTNQADETREDVKEVKKDVKEVERIDVSQSVLIERALIQVNMNSKLIEKLIDKQ